MRCYKFSRCPTIASSFLRLAYSALFGIAVTGYPPVAAQQISSKANQIEFDIPAQPLIEALEAFSASSGYQVLVADPAAAAFRSSSIKGLLLPRDALIGIVAATGLKIRYTATTSVILVPDRSTASTQFTSTDGLAAVEKTQFDGALQGAVLRALCRDAGLRRGNYRLALDIWVRSSGQVDRVELLGSTGSVYLDDRIITTLRSVVSSPPVRGLTQPTTMLIGLSSSRPNEVCDNAPPETYKLMRAAHR